jgi:hypothetical protein
MLKIKKYYKGARKKVTAYIEYNEGRLSGLDTVRRNCLLKCIIEEKIPRKIRSDELT